MSRISEALEYERRQQNGPAWFPVESSPEADTGNLLDIEEEMLDLYQTVDALLPQKSEGKMLQFISSRPGEGTSTISRAFAQVAATRLRRTVLLLEADTPPADQGPCANGPPEGCFAGVMKPGEVLEKVDLAGQELRVFTAALPVRSAAIWAFVNSPQMEEYLKTLQQRFDLILIDSPAIATSPAGLALCSRVHGVLLVVEAENTRWPVAKSVKDKIAKAGGHIIGIILNKRRYYIPSFIYDRL